MKVKETLKQAHVTRDKKARRRTNTSELVPNIDMDTLERGVTIEQLENLNVPVYQYATQITIHGRWEWDGNGYVKGYKSLIRNGNGTLGVKYSAIDAGKKAILRRASIAARRLDRDGWTIKQDSTGTYAYKIFREKPEAIDCYNNAPIELFSGSRSAHVLLYGRGYLVRLSIGIIREENLWPLTRILTSIKSQQELEKLEAAYHEQRERETAKWEAERKARNAEKKARREAEAKRLTAILEEHYQSTDKIAPGNYVRVSIPWRGDTANIEYWEIWKSASSGKLRHRRVNIKNHTDRPKVNRRKGRDLEPKRYPKKLYKV